MICDQLFVMRSFNPLKVCHTKIDRMRSMGVCPLNFVVCRRMATKLPMKLPNAFLYTKLKSFRGVHIQLLAEIGDRSTSFSYPRSRVSAQQALECLDYLDANEPFDFSDGDVRGSGSDLSYDGDLSDDSGDDKNGAVHRCDSSVALCYSYGIHLILDVRYCTSHPYKRMCFLIIQGEQYCKSLNFLAIAIGL